MSKYVFNLVKELNQTSNKLVNYLCKDNFMHIRLRDFGYKKEVISGLEDKLTFYVVWQLNKLLPKYLEYHFSNIINKDKYKELFESCIYQFKCSDEFSEIKLVMHCLYPNCKGLDILPRYSKKDDYLTVMSMFGSLDAPYNDISFDEFVEMSLYQFLVDENIFLVVDKKKQVNCTKYIKKYAKKNKNSLWED